jgi:hypothetical protein
MRLALIGYFDLGRSLSLKDEAFRGAELSDETDRGLVALTNPFGRGTTLDLVVDKPSVVDDKPSVIDLWRRAAGKQLERSELETGWQAESDGMSKKQHDVAVAQCVRSHRIAHAELTVFGIGTVLVRLEFDGGIPRRIIRGVSKCFEFAAYTPEVADALEESIENHLKTLPGRQTSRLDRFFKWLLGEQRSRLERVSERPPPVAITDRKKYTERMLIPFFTPVFMFTDSEDEVGHAQDLRKLNVTSGAPEAGSGGQSEYEPIPFEYHGVMYYSWESIILVPKSWDNPAELPTDKILRMVECIKIAHVFNATLEAFDRLLESEIGRQLSGFTQGGRPRRSLQHLNQLRTLALAVAYTANFAAVTPSKEDQTYFLRFSADAKLQERRDAIVRFSEVLYSIQGEEDQRKQDRLNLIVVLLTTLTLLSVLADVFDYVDIVDPSLVPTVQTRLWLLFAVVLSILTTVVAAVVLLRK